MGMLQGGPVDYAGFARTTAAVGETNVTLTKPSGLEVGDIVFGLLTDTPSTSSISTTGGSTWSRQSISAPGSNDGFSVLIWKVMTATDLANAWVLNILGYYGMTLFRFRGLGATGATVKSTSAGTGTSRALTGFAKAVNSYGVISFLGAAGSPTAVKPSNLNQQYNALNGAERMMVADSGGYVDGASVTWTALEASSGSVAYLVEVTGE